MLRGMLIVGMGTLLSRLLGMFRDMATAHLLGMSAGGIMDAFVFAFRLPDVARRFFGDGTLGVSFIPVFAKTWQEDRQQGTKKVWILLSLMLSRVFLCLTVFVLVGEVLCSVAINFFHPDGKVAMTAHLLALLLPYLILICMAAIASASLQALGRFSISSLIPSVLNIVWLFGVTVLAPIFSDDPATQCYLLALCILAAGVIQFLLHIPFLKFYGFRFDPRFSEVRDESKKVFGPLFPQIFGLMTMQLNILLASAVAWLFTGPAEGTIRWLCHAVEFPLRSGAVSALYYSERLYEFPQGLIGLAIATAIYPLLSRHAAEKNFRSLGEDLSLGLRIQFAFSIPAGVGLMLLSDNLSHLLFQHGAFTPSDMQRTADLVFFFGAGVWAFCSLPIIVRAFYVVEDMTTPLRIGIFCCILNVTLALPLIWPLQERGLALAATISAAVQSLLLFFRYATRHGHIDFRAILLGIVRATAAAGIMALAVRMTLEAMPGHDSLADVLHIAVGGGLGLGVELFAYRFMGGRELGILVRGYVKG